MRPIIENVNPVWGPYYITDQRPTEGVQIHATKLISSIRHYTYPERLQVLNLPSLYCRQYRGDMILMYQVTHKNIDGSLLNLFTVAPVFATRGHNFKFLKHSCTCYRTDLFSFRSINKQNSLASYIVNANSIKSIRQFLLWHIIYCSLVTHMHAHTNTHIGIDTQTHTTCCRSGFYRLSAFYPVILNTVDRENFVVKKVTWNKSSVRFNFVKRESILCTSTKELR